MPFLILTILVSTTVSKGISAHLLKPNAKRRRTKAQKEEDDAKALAKALEIENKLAAVESMQSKLLLMESQVEEAKGLHSQLQGLLASGALQLDDKGQLKPVHSQEQATPSQSAIPNIKRSESQLSHSSQQSYGSHLRKARNAKAEQQAKDDEMTG